MYIIIKFLSFIDLKVYSTYKNVHNTPFQVLNFRPKSIGEPPEDSTKKKTQRFNHTPICEVQKQRAQKPYKRYNT